VELILRVSHLVQQDIISAPRPTGMKKEGSTIELMSATQSEEARKNAMEYGFPSSHAMNSTVLFGYIALYLRREGYVPHGSAPWLYLGVALWVVWICSARVYMGGFNGNAILLPVPLLQLPVQLPSGCRVDSLLGRDLCSPCDDVVWMPVAGLHTPVDVIGGLIAGLLTLVLYCSGIDGTLLRKKREWHPLPRFLTCHQ
jgi:membrane-associated phospholipid phosphatase